MHHAIFTNEHFGISLVDFVFIFCMCESKHEYGRIIAQRRVTFDQLIIQPYRIAQANICIVDAKRILTA
jgi:hypothetical protein